MIHRKPNIYLDLDETLIHSIPGRPGMGINRRRKVIPCGIKPNGKPDTYHADLRDLARELIARCQSLGPTKILTTATREYALAHIKAFSLPFSSEDVIAREDYTYEAKGPWGGYELLVKAVNVDRAAFLLDNTTPETEAGRAKMLFLGIPKENFLVVQEYQGGKESAASTWKLWDLVKIIEDKTQKERGPAGPAAPDI